MLINNSKSGARKDIWLDRRGGEDQEIQRQSQLSNEDIKRELYSIYYYYYYYSESVNPEKTTIQIKLKHKPF